MKRSMDPLRLISNLFFGIFLMLFGYALFVMLSGSTPDYEQLLLWVILLSISSFVCIGLLWRRVVRDESGVDEHVLKNYSDSLRQGKRKLFSRRRMTNEDLAFQILKTQAELKSLQQQISPHFLYNTLESIRAKALCEDAGDVAEMIEMLARFFRYNISRQREFSTIRGEVENVSNYVRIQNGRFRDKFRFIMSLDEIEDLMDSYYMPIMSLQPIVENALHHGLEHKLGIGTINLRAFKTQNRLMMQIEDDGVGMDETTVYQIRELLHGNSSSMNNQHDKHNSNGIALINTHQRMQLFFGSEYGINLSSVLGGGTLVEFVMPLKSPKPLEKEPRSHEA